MNRKLCRAASRPTSIRSLQTLYFGLFGTVIMTGCGDNLKVEPEFTNTAPTIGALAEQTTREDTALAPVDISVGDMETDAGLLAVTATSSDTSIVADEDLVLDGDGANRTLTITPVADANGTVTITLTVSDGLLSAMTSFDVIVEAVNDPPTISAIDDQSVPEDTSTGPLAFTVNDIDNDITTLTVTGTSSDQAVVADIDVQIEGTDANRTVTVTPVAKASGTTSITLTVSDGGSEGDAIEMFNVSVAVVDDVPTVSMIAPQTTDEDVATGAIAFTVGDVDTPLSSLVITAVSSDQGVVADGALVLGGVDENRTLMATPVANASGVTTITITVSDGGPTPTITSFDLTVNPVNDPPTISDIFDQSIDEDTSTGALAFTINDIDTPIGMLMVTVTSSDQGLVPDANLVLGGADANRTITATPTPGASGSAVITVTVSDGGIEGDGVDTFTLNVSSVNDPPTVSMIGDTTTDEDIATGALPFTIGDTETPIGSLVVTATSSDQMLLPDANLTLGGADANRTISAMPAADQNGTATITVTVMDGGGFSAMSAFMLTVNAVNDPPTITPIADQTIAENTDTGALAFTIDDIDTPVGTLMVSAVSSDTALVPNANLTFGGAGGSRTITVTPAAGGSGATTVTLTVSDGGAEGDGVTMFDVTVMPVNDPPVISDIADQTIDEDTDTGALAFTISDIDDAANTLILSGNSSNTTLVPVANIVFGGADENRTVTVTPVADQDGTATITITVTDPGAESAMDTFTLTVNAINDPPIATDDTFLAGAGTTGNVQLTVAASVLANDMDPDGPMLSVTPVTGTANTSQGGDVTINADGTFVYTPAPGFLGTDTFTYTLNDNDAGMNLTDMGTVSVEVSAPMVWFVDNSAGALGTGDGRDVSPFTLLKSAESASGSGDTIQVARGDGTTNGYNQGIILQDGQSLIGDVMPGPPQLEHNAGNVITLASGNTVSSFDIVSSNAAAVFGSNNQATSTISGLMVANCVGGISLVTSPTGTFNFSGLELTTSGTTFYAETVGSISVMNTVATSTGGTAIDIQQSTLDNAVFTATNANSSTSPGVSLSDNMGSIDLGAVNINTDGSKGIDATNAGMISATSGVVTSMNAPAVDISMTGLSMTLTTLNSDGAGQGLLLQNTSGSFSVAGDGSGTRNGSGGTVSNTSFDGVLLINATNVSLASMNIQDTPNDGMYVQGVNGLTLRGVSLTTNGNGTGDQGIEMSEVTGVVIIQNTEIHTSAHNAVFLLNTGTTEITRFDIIDSIFRDNSAINGNAGFNVETRNAARINDMNVTGSTFSGLFAAGIIVGSLDTSFIDLSVRTSSFMGNNIGFQASTSGASNMALDFSQNATITGHMSHSVIVSTASSTSGGGITGIIEGNTIGTSGMAGSGSASGHGLRMTIQGQAHGTLAVRNNTIQNVVGRGIELLVRLGTGGADVTLEGNTIVEPDAFAAAGMFLNSNHGNPLCANVINNNVDGGPSFAPYGGDFAVLEGDISAGFIFLEGFDTSAVNTLMVNGNTGVDFNESGVNIGAPPTGTCAVP